MNTMDVSKFYDTLPNGEKGRFTAFLSLRLGGSPHTWQQKILDWGHNTKRRPLSPILERELDSIVKSGVWRL